MSAPATASASKTYHSALSEKLANFGEDLKNEDLKDIQELGQGNGGSVKKVEHTPTGTIMAKKVRGVFLFTLVRPSTTPSFVFRPRDHYPRVVIARGAVISLLSQHIFTHLYTDRPNRRETVGEETDPARVTDHARLQLAIHHLVLRRVHLGSQHLYLHGVYG